MSGVIEISSSDFPDQVLGSHVPVLLDFYAQWCGPCKAVLPTLEDLAREYEGEAKILKIDIEAAPDIASQYGVTSVPTFLMINAGEVTQRLVGAQTRSRFSAHIEDMLAA